MKKSVDEVLEANRQVRSNFTELFPRIHHQLGYQIVRKQPKSGRVRSLMKFNLLLMATAFHPGFIMANSPDSYEI